MDSRYVYSEIIVSINQLEYLIYDGCKITSDYIHLFNLFGILNMTTDNITHNKKLRARMMTQKKSSLN